MKMSQIGIDEKNWNFYYPCKNCWLERDKLDTRPDHINEMVDIYKEMGMASTVIYCKNCKEYSVTSNC
jgi:hypothetical protein